jgi:hypothetical protein
MNCRYALAPTKNLPREQAREEIINRAIAHKAQYVAMLDDDIQPPADFIQAMTRELDSRPEYDIIAAVCPSVNNEPMIFKEPAGGPYWRWKQGDVFEIAECATACIMIRTHLFETLPKPWFRDLNTVEECVEAGMYKMFEYDRGQMTDDIYFCTKARQAGHRLLAHGGVLPIHWNRKGEYAEIKPDSYPFQPEHPIDSNGHVNIERALKIQGWMTEIELRWLAEQASRVQVKRIVEIGSWMGRSTRAFADNIGPDGIVYAVDTWEGSPECGQMEKLPIDWIYDQFKVNMRDHLGSDGMGLVRATKTTSLNMAAILETHKIEPCEKFDLVFIDASHDYEDVKADILAWLPLVKPGGIICGHDYCTQWPGVVQAVNELVPGAKHAAGSIWYDVTRDG